MARHERFVYESPWRSFAASSPDAEPMALVTFIELRSVWSLPRFEWYSRQIQRQLAGSPGLVGYSFRARLPRSYWTLSVWESNRDLLRFVRTKPHARVMGILPPHTRRFASERWRLTDDEVRVSWAEALGRLAAASPAPSSGASVAGVGAARR